MIDLIGDTSACGHDCAWFIDKWASWWAQKTRDPLAMLEVTSLDEYLHFIGGKSRNMVSKAKRLYTFSRIAFNDHLAGIEAVARSSPIRQGMPMEGWYTKPVETATPARLCALHADEWYGAFERESGRMVAFARLEVLNELGILNSILGDRSAGGAVNGLVAHLVEHSGVCWINYLYPQARTDTLADFKRRLGFRPMLVPASASPAEVRA